MSDKSYTTFEIAQICGFTIRGVTQWIEKGKLEAYRTPGGHRRIKEVDFLAFLKRYKMPVPPSLLTASQPKILIVDDDKSLATLIRKSLQASFPGLIVEVAHDGFQAGQMVTSLSPDLVVLDIKLPGMDGFAVCTRIKAQSQKIHVLAMTGDASPSVKKRILDCGADAFLPKPFELSRLKDEVIQLMGVAGHRK